MTKDSAADTVAGASFTKREERLLALLGPGVEGLVRATLRSREGRVQILEGMFSEALPEAGAPVVARQLVALWSLLWGRGTRAERASWVEYRTQLEELCSASGVSMEVYLQELG